MYCKVNIKKNTKRKEITKPVVPKFYGKHLILYFISSADLLQSFICCSVLSFLAFYYTFHVVCIPDYCFHSAPYSVQLISYAPPPNQILCFLNEYIQADTRKHSWDTFVWFENFPITKTTFFVMFSHFGISFYLLIFNTQHRDTRNVERKRKGTKGTR